MRRSRPSRACLSAAYQYVGGLSMPRNIPPWGMAPQPGDNQCVPPLVVPSVPSLPGTRRCAARLGVGVCSIVMAVGVLAPVRAGARDPGDLDRQITAATEKLESLIEQRHAA